jgi:DNA polymerase
MPASVGRRAMIVGEAPGQQEDEQGIPFVGRSGQLLTYAIAESGFTRADVTITNIVKCRPQGNATPTKVQMDACSLYLYKEIEEYNPFFILCLGNIAAQQIMKRSGVSSFHGEWYASRDRMYMATYHPSYVLRQKHLQQLFFADVANFFVEAYADEPIL